MDPGETVPEETARREVSEELKDKDTGEDFQLGEIKHFKTFVDARPGEHNIFTAELDEVPNIITTEGQGLVFLSPEEARKTHFAYGYREVVNEYLDSIEPSPTN